MSRQISIYVDCVNQIFRDSNGEMEVSVTVSPDNIKTFMQNFDIFELNESLTIDQIKDVLAAKINEQG